MLGHHHKDGIPKTRGIATDDAQLRKIGSHLLEVKMRRACDIDFYQPLRCICVKAHLMYAAYFCQGQSRLKQTTFVVSRRHGSQCLQLHDAFSIYRDLMHSHPALPSDGSLAQAGMLDGRQSHNSIGRKAGQTGDR